MYYTGNSTVSATDVVVPKMLVTRTAPRTIVRNSCAPRQSTKHGLIGPYYADCEHISITAKSGRSVDSDWHRTTHVATPTSEVMLLYF